LNKLNQLFLNENVIKYLDDIQNLSINYDPQEFNQEIFINQENENENSSNKSFDSKRNNLPVEDLIKPFNSNDNYRRFGSCISPVKRNRLTIVNSNVNQNENNSSRKLVSFNSNLDKIKDNVSSDLKNQIDKFEEKKKNKFERLKSLKEGKYIQ
jgi:hypothetical protein